MSDLISAASLTRLPDMLSEYGADPAEFLGRAGIDLSLVGAQDRYVPFTALSSALGMAARDLRVPDFALRLASRQDPDILGPLAIMARNAGTVGAALRAVNENTHVYSPALETGLRPADDSYAYECRTLLRRIPSRDHVVELALGVTLATFRMLVGDDFLPLRVTFEHPRIAERAAYVEHFGCPVEFQAGVNSMVFPRALMDRRMRQVDPHAHDLAMRVLAKTDRHTAFPDAVATIIRRAMPVGAAALPQVAALLMMHPRAVQRRLVEAGLTFEELVDQVRRDTADGLLANPEVPVAMVARRLGYSEQSSLTRSCRRWFAVTPRERRRQLTSAVD